MSSLVWFCIVFYGSYFVVFLLAIQEHGDLRLLCECIRENLSACRHMVVEDESRILLAGYDVGAADVSSMGNCELV